MSQKEKLLQFMSAISTLHSVLKELQNHDLDVVKDRTNQFIRFLSWSVVYADNREELRKHILEDILNE